MQLAAQEEFGLRGSCLVAEDVLESAKGYLDEGIENQCDVFA